MSFEDFLKEVHAQDYMGTDDMMTDSFESWLVDLESDDFLKHAEEWKTIT